MTTPMIQIPSFNEARSTLGLGVGVGFEGAASGSGDWAAVDVDSMIHRISYFYS